MNTYLHRYASLLALGILLGWNFVLVAYRIQVTHELRFIFFVWNLFLAALPVGFGRLAWQYHQRGLKWLSWGFLLLAVLFLPNSPYVITDLFHLRAREEMPLWFDTMLVFSAAATGLALFYLALFDISRVLKYSFNRWTAEISVAVICLLCGFGIYLGRYLRFNSWDVLSNPNDLFEEIGNRLINPSIHTRTLGVTILYGAFLLTGYWIVKLYRRALHLEWQARA